LLAGGIGLVIQFAVSFIVGGLAVAANNRAVGWVHLGERATIRGSYASILPKTGRYVWLMLIMLVILWTPLALAYGGYLFAIFAWITPLSKGGLHNLVNPTTAAPDQRTVMMLGLATVLFGLFFVVAFAYALVMFLRYALAVAACVVEDLKAWRAIGRSVELSKGSRGRIFVLALLVVVIQLGLVGITQIFFIMMAFRHGQLPAGGRVAQQLVAFATNTFIAPIYATGLTLFYYDQRVRKEGYDIEWMMQAAGLTPPEPPGLTPPEPPAGEPMAPAVLPDQTEHA
jgi:flagellar basal body-associated protein FliL